MKLFEINTEAEVLIEKFQDSKIITIRNFYRNPDKILAYLENNRPSVYKKNELNKHNGTEFLDCRHEIQNQEITEVYNYLSSFTGASPIGSDMVVTNVIQFYDQKYNDYRNNFWWPHQDEGYNAICYFNKGSFPGTNIYLPQTHPAKLKLYRRSFGEHYNPWESKDKWYTIKTIESEFNKLVIFDGKLYYHGMAIEDQRFFNEKRINQVFFFKNTDS